MFQLLNAALADDFHIKQHLRRVYHYRYTDAMHVFVFASDPIIATDIQTGYAVAELAIAEADTALTGATNTQQRAEAQGDLLVGIQATIENSTLLQEEVTQKCRSYNRSTASLLIGIDTQCVQQKIIKC